jgi:hypothetical protein
MEASSVDLRANELTPARARSRFRSLIGNRPSGTRGGTEAELVQALDAEVTLLREENARLRSARESAADPGQIISRLSELPGPQDDADHGDDAWHVLTAGLVLRDTLLEVCAGIAQAMAVQEERLHALAADLGIETPLTAAESLAQLPPAASG